MSTDTRTRGILCRAYPEVLLEWNNYISFSLKKKRKKRKKKKEKRVE